MKNMKLGFMLHVLVLLMMCMPVSFASTLRTAHSHAIFGMFPGNHMKWLPPAKVAHPQQQLWNGYCPVCTLDSKTQCKAYQCQTANMLSPLYDNINVSSDRWIRVANRAALESSKQGGGPFGAVILQVDDKTNTIIRYWVSHNQVVERHDPSAHAEIATIREAASALGVVNLGHIHKKDAKLPQPGTWSHCIIYSSAEPCPMCMSAIYWSGMRRLYFAATRYDAAVEGVNFSDEMIYEELKRSYADRRHMMVRHVIANNSLDAFNYFKRNPVPRYGQNK